MHQDLLHQIALTLVPNIGDVRAKALLETFGDAESIFKAAKKNLENIEGIGTIAANSIKHFADFRICEDEIKFINDKPSFLKPSFHEIIYTCHYCAIITWHKFSNAGTALQQAEQDKNCCTGITS